MIESSPSWNRALRGPYQFGRLNTGCVVSWIVVEDATAGDRGDRDGHQGKRHERMHGCRFAAWQGLIGAA